MAAPFSESSLLTNNHTSLARQGRPVHRHEIDEQGGEKWTKKCEKTTHWKTGHPPDKDSNWGCGTSENWQIAVKSRILKVLVRAEIVEFWRAKRESGVTPELPRSGNQERNAQFGTGSGQTELGSRAK